MKPILHFNHNSKRNDGAERRFPVTDFNYQSLEISDCNARCADFGGNSFRTTREYFDKEAARDFLTETALFAMIMLAVASPLLSGIHAIVDLLPAIV